MLTDEERDTLIDGLTTLKFIKSYADGELHAASDYFDAENRLFQLMLSRDMFPPEPFDNYRWVCAFNNSQWVCTFDNYRWVCTFDNYRWVCTFELKAGLIHQFFVIQYYFDT